MNPNGMDRRGFWIPGLARSARSPGMTKKEVGSPGMTGEKAMTAVVPAEARRRAGTSQRLPAV